MFFPVYFDYTFCNDFFLSGVRSAILGMLGIEPFPLFFLRGRPIRALIQLFVVIFWSRWF
jgi:hypothetical protein